MTVKSIDTHGEGVGGVLWFEKFGHKNTKKGGPLDFLTTPSAPLEEFGQHPKDPPPSGFLTTVHLCSNLFSFFLTFAKYFKHVVVTFTLGRI